MVNGPRSLLPAVLPRVGQSNRLGSDAFSGPSPLSGQRWRTRTTSSRTGETRSGPGADQFDCKSLEESANLRLLQRFSNIEYYEKEYEHTAGSSSTSGNERSSHTLLQSPRFSWHGSFCSRRKHLRGAKTRGC